MEDWFVVATSQKSAENFHEESEGFDKKYAKARHICDIPLKTLKSHLKVDDNCWPNIDLLKELKLKIIYNNFPRVISYNGEVFQEGKGYAKYAEDKLSNLDGVYVINLDGGNKYKIGRTKNLKSRLNSFRTGSPGDISLIYFILTRHNKELERFLHNEFKMNRVNREWFEFNNNELIKLKEISSNLNIDTFLIDMTLIYN